MKDYLENFIDMDLEAKFGIYCNHTVIFKNIEPPAIFK